MSLIDVMHLGRDRVIGAYEIDGLIVDPGPSSCMDTLVAGLEEEPRALLLTHIHLDHAGASGSLVRRFPGLRVYVHESGAQHLVDPAKLLESATRLYGDDMVRLWGDVLPVPAESVVALVGGESIEGFRVAHAPGHARHHVVYLHEATGDAYVGDVAGVRIPPIDFTIPPTPPPDIDVEAWRESLAKIRDWKPETVFITHFGAYAGAAEHLDRFETSLSDVVEMARRIIHSGASDEAKYEQFRDEVLAYVRAAVNEEEVRPLEFVGPLEFNWRGLLRYWKKRGAA